MSLYLYILHLILNFLCFCRSRFADFLSNCQPSHQTASGCLKDSTGLCLRAYAGLIGTKRTKKSKWFIRHYRNLQFPFTTSKRKTFEKQRSHDSINFDSVHKWVLCVCMVTCKRFIFGNCTVSMDYHQKQDVMTYLVKWGFDVLLCYCTNQH